MKKLLVVVNILFMVVIIIVHREAWAIDDPLTTFNPRLYIFVDDHWIASSSGIKRIVNSAIVLPTPIIAPDDPKTQIECAWGNVIHEPDGRFRLWYLTMMGSGHGMAKAGVWGRGDDFSFHPRSEADFPLTEITLGKYAESTDGIHWIKPELDLIQFRGSSRNNIIITGENASRQTDGALTNFDGYTIVRDDNEIDPQKRYKMIAHWESVHFWDNHELSGSLGRSPEKMEKFKQARGKYITYSPDGVRWVEPLKRIPFPDGEGDRFLVVRDYRNNRWWGYSRLVGWNNAALSTSTDLETWSEPVIEQDLAPIPDKFPAIESLIPFNYGNQDLGFAVGMDKKKGILPSYLVSHHDGEPWKWIEKENPFIPTGEKGNYTSTGAVPLHNEPFVVGDSLYIYFNAFAYDGSCPAGSRTIGLATMRRDGFVGITSDGMSAVLVTKPLRVSGNNLYMNVEPGTQGGILKVELLTPDMNPMKGYTYKEAIPLSNDMVRHPVAWKKKRNVKDLVGKDVVVKMYLENGAVLYALAFGE